MKAIKKLQEHNIFKKDSIVESVITKDWMGSPVEKKVHLIVRKLRKDDCLSGKNSEMCPLALPAVRSGLLPQVRKLSSRMLSQSHQWLP